jgi:hypothetical protein
LKIDEKIIGKEMQFSKHNILLIPSNETENLAFNEGIQSAEKDNSVLLHKLTNETASVAIDAINDQLFVAFSSFKKNVIKPATTGMSINKTGNIIFSILNDEIKDTAYLYSQSV